MTIQPVKNRSQARFRNFNKTEIEQSIPARFAQQVFEHPNRLAVKSSNSESLSYRQLHEASNQIANFLLAARGANSEPIAFLLAHGTTAVEAILGILKAGKIYVALEPSLPEGELRRMVADCDPGLILTEAKHSDLAAKIASGHRCVNLNAIDLDLHKGDIGRAISPGSPAYIFYTSGSTGTPKGVCDSHHNVLHNIMRYTNNLQVSPNDRHSLIQSFSFSGTVSSLFLALLNGATVYLFDLQYQGIKKLADWIIEEKLTVFHAVPMIFEQLMATQKKFPHLRVIRLEGDRAKMTHILDFQERFGPDCTLVNGLGTTETGIIRQYFVTPQTKVPGGPVPIGHAVEDMHVVLLDDSGRAVSDGEIGQIAVRSRFLAIGYWNNPTLTALSFVDDEGMTGYRTYRTGDMGRIMPGGCLQYLDRKDFAVKIRGQRIETREIEEALCALPTIRYALVSVWLDRSGRQQLVAHIVTSGNQPTVSEIRGAISQTLPQIMIPARYVFLDRLPLDPNQKVLRRHLPTPDNDRPRLASEFIAARTRRQKLIGKCFESTLGVCPVGLHDDFFELGGDSLLATELTLCIEKKLRVACPPVFPFPVGNIAGLDELLDDSTPEIHTVTLQHRGVGPPLFAINCAQSYQDLAKALAPDHTLIALCRGNFLEPPGPDNALQNLARRYIEEIRHLQPVGPYRLCGNCNDGIFAFEVAQQLRTAGHDICFLGLIDTRFPSRPEVCAPWRIGSLEILHLAREKSRRFRAVIHRRLQPYAPNAKFLSGFLTRQLNRDMLNYRPLPYDGEVVLFCLGEPHNQRGWNTVIEQRLKIVKLPLLSIADSAHLPHLIEVPYVERLAAEIRKQLVDNAV